MKDYDTGRPVIKTFKDNVRILIEDEQKRLEYLISYCLKNYYIGYANMLSSGEFIPKWKHEDKLKDVVRDFGAIKGEITELQVVANGHRYKVI